MLDETNTNLLGVIRITAALLPHCCRFSAAPQQGNATLINISSGPSFDRLARFPVYSASKAAVHSFTVLLRHQLKGTSVKVIELVPPCVATELGAEVHVADEKAPALCRSRLLLWKQ
jgi:uncharacterized oxidoreductase